MKKTLFILCLFVLATLCYAQEIEQEVVKTDKQTNTISMKATGMYDGTESAKADEFFSKAGVYAQNKDLENAEKFYLKAIKEDPSFVEAYDNVGRIYRSMGNYDKAVEYYKKSIELYPDGMMAHQNLAVVYSIQENINGAIAEYDELLRINPDGPEGYFGKANSYMMVGKFDMALENCNKAIEIYETTNADYLADGYYLRGLINYYKEDKEEAAKDIRIAKNKGAKINPQLEQELLGGEEEYKMESPEDYAKYEQDVVNAFNWLMETPLGTEPEKRRSLTAFILKWAISTPSVSIELSDKTSDYPDCLDCLGIFLGGWSAYSIETDNYDKEAAKLAAVEGVIDFYTKNRSKLKKTKLIEKFIKLKRKGKLKQYLKKS